MAWKQYHGAALQDFYLGLQDLKKKEINWYFLSDIAIAIWFAILKGIMIFYILFKWSLERLLHVQEYLRQTRIFD